MTMTANQIRVMIVDDQTMIRQGIRALLGFCDGIEVVAEAGNGDEAVDLARVARPDVVLMDIRMPGTDGIEATRRIRLSDPPPAVIILTTFDQDDYVLDAVRAGAAGFLLKDGDVDDLARAIRVAVQGDAIIAPSVLGSLIANLAVPPHHHREAVDAVATLTDREREVLGHVAAGRRNDEICEALRISAATTKTHISHLFAKLGVRDRAQAVVMAYESGLVTPGRAHEQSPR